MIDHLGPLARTVAAEWGLALGEPFSLARHSFTAPAGNAVLKLAPVEDDEADFEADALVAWQGQGAVRLLRHDRARRALLIERAAPGFDASTVSEDEALAAALSVGRRLWREFHGGLFPRAWDRLPERLAMVEPTGHPFVGIAKRLLEKMERRGEVLVHGDFHHHNLLRHGDYWVAIDPKPLLAEPEFDVVTLLWNPLGVMPTPERTESRIKTFAAAGLDAQRIRDWAVIRGVYLGLPTGPDDYEHPHHLAVVHQLTS